jgi:hypothetical protein
MALVKALALTPATPPEGRTPSGTVARFPRSRLTQSRPLQLVVVLVMIFDAAGVETAVCAGVVVGFKTPALTPTRPLGLPTPSVAVASGPTPRVMQVKESHDKLVLVT